MQRIKVYWYVMVFIFDLRTEINHVLQYWITEERIPRFRLKDLKEGLKYCSVLLDRLYQIGRSLYGQPPADFSPA